jgi:hypothetical protein
MVMEQQKAMQATSKKHWGLPESEVPGYLHKVITHGEVVSNQLRPLSMDGWVIRVFITMAEDRTSLPASERMALLYPLIQQGGVTLNENAEATA